MSAIRLARAATGREKLLKFAGAYHGHVDGLLAEAGIGPGDAGHPGVSPGVPAAATAATRSSCRGTTPRRSTRALAEHEFAAILAEPTRRTWASSRRADGFLELPARARRRQRRAARLRRGHHRLPRRAAAAPRSSPASLPDLTVMGKVIGGGLPAAAYGGSRELMERIAPAGDVYQAGTLSGNPLAVAAGLRDAARCSTTQAYARLAATTERAGRRAARGAPGDRPVQVQSRAPGLLTVFFSDDARRATTPARRPATSRPTARGAAALLARGVYPPPSQFEAWFPSLAHTAEHVERTVEAARGRVRRGIAVSERRAELRELGRAAARRGSRRPPLARSRAGRGPTRADDALHYGAAQSPRRARTATWRCSTATGCYAAGWRALAAIGDLTAIARAGRRHLAVRAGARRGPARDRRCRVDRGRGRDRLGRVDPTCVGAKHARTRRTARRAERRHLRARQPTAFAALLPMAETATARTKSKYTADRQIPGAFEGETVTRRRFMTGSVHTRRRRRGRRRSRCPRSASRSGRSSRSTSSSWNRRRRARRLPGRHVHPARHHARPPASARSARPRSTCASATRRSTRSRRTSTTSSSRSRPAACTSAAPCASSQASRSASSARATAASTTSSGEVDGGPPVRPLDRFYTRVRGTATSRSARASA